MEISDGFLPNLLFLGKIDEVAYQQSIDAVKYHVVYSICLLILTWLFCFWLNNRRDL